MQTEPKSGVQIQYLTNMRNSPNKSISLDGVREGSERPISQRTISQRTTKPLEVGLPLANFHDVLKSELAKSYQDPNVQSSRRRKGSSKGQGFSAFLALEMLMNDMQAQAEQEEDAKVEEKPLIEYQKQSEEIRMQREQMEMELKQMHNEQLRFQREEERFAEEEEQMRRFVEDVKRAEERDRQNEERRRMEKEEQMRVFAEDVKCAEERDRENEERRGKEEEEAAQRVLQLVENLALEDSDSNFRGKRPSKLSDDERLAKEEADRMNAEFWLYVEEEKKAQCLRLEEGNGRQDRRRLEDERVPKQRGRAAKEGSDQLQHEEDEAQRLKEEKIANHWSQQRRAAKERAEQLRNEGKIEMEGVDKDEELRKAEDKIRATVVGLVEERVQVSGNFQGQTKLIRKNAKVGNPTGGVPRNDRGKVDVNAEKGVSRYNTVGTRRPTQGSPRAVSRGNTVGARPVNNFQGGLPNGPRAGGLPNGPKAGLPVGPRAKGRTET